MSRCRVGVCVAEEQDEEHDQEAAVNRGGDVCQRCARAQLGTASSVASRLQCNARGVTAIAQKIVSFNKHHGPKAPYPAVARAGLERQASARGQLDEGRHLQGR